MLVDAFMFYNELDILELRLSVLDRHVDRFVLVESEVTHVGGPKELFFQKNRDRFAKWLPKIEHVIVTAADAPSDTDPWSREKYQRECILRGLEGVPDDAVVMVSDVDEIPDMDKVRYEKLEHAMTSVHMWLFIYSLEYMLTSEPWFGTVITNCELLRRVGPNSLRDARWKMPCFQYAGWHLSSFGTPEHVLNKVHTFAHALDGHHVAQTLDMFQTFIEEGIHTDGKTALVCRPDSVPLPGPESLLRHLGLMRFETDQVRVGKYTVSVIRDDMYIGGCLRQGHEWDGWMRQDLPHITSVGKDILDIGGNIGWNSLMYSEYSPVHVFEPIFHPVVAKNIRQNSLSDRITLHPFALGSKKDVVDMYVQKHHEGMCNYGGTSLYKSSHREDSGVQVRVERLDDVYTGTPCLLKIDVEGHELEVLKGAEQTLRKHRPNLYVEIFEFDGPVPTFLRELGYTKVFPRPEDNYLFIHEAS